MPERQTKKERTLHETNSSALFYKAYIEKEKELYLRLKNIAITKQFNLGGVSVGGWLELKREKQADRKNRRGDAMT